MGIFGFLFGKETTNCVSQTDAVFLAHEAKAIGFTKAVQQARERSNVLVGCHFADSLNEACGILDIAKVPFQVCEVWEEKAKRELAESEIGSVTVTMIESLPFQSFDSLNQVIDESRNLMAFGYERHPLREEDERISGFLANLPCKSTMKFFVSLDDPLVQLFAGPSMKRLLQALDMDPSESIENDIVARRIGQAQRKIEQAAVSNNRTESMKAWFDTNMPN